MTVPATSEAASEATSPLYSVTVMDHRTGQDHQPRPLGGRYPSVDWARAQAVALLRALRAAGTLGPVQDLTRRITADRGVPEHPGAGDGPGAGGSGPGTGVVARWESDDSLVTVLIEEFSVPWTLEDLREDLALRVEFSEHQDADVEALAQEITATIGVRGYRLMSDEEFTPLAARHTPAPKTTPADYQVPAGTGLSEAARRVADVLRAAGRADGAAAADAVRLYNAEHASWVMASFRDLPDGPAHSEATSLYGEPYPFPPAEGTGTLGASEIYRWGCAQAGVESLSITPKERSVCAAVYWSQHLEAWVNVMRRRTDEVTREARAAGVSTR